MTDNLESNSTEGSAGSPNPAVSAAQNVSSTSTLDAQKLPDQLESLVSKAVEKALQSQKDKRFSTIEKTLDGFKPVMEQVQALLTPEQLKEFKQIQKDAEFEELKKAVFGGTQTSTQPSGTQKGTAEEAQAVFEEYSINPNDPEAIPLLGLQGTDLVKAVSKLAIKRAKQSTPDSSEAPSLSSGAPKPVGIGGLTEQYQKDMLTARGKPSLLKDIKEKARKAGVPVDSIAFV